ncbi:MAG: hypothetical protein AB7J47_19645 [Acidimicrobiia bacterium]
MPTFSNPTSITNPYFSVSGLEQVIQLGEEAGSVARNEITVLPETRVIDWNGQQVETVVSQFIGYLDGRIVEGALDYFAQADDGSVWYFGEDVDNYEDGAILDHDGTWLAGRDGLPGMIMPARPAVGVVFRPENVPGMVFEEDVVASISEVLVGPSGQISGGVLVEEHLMDGETEQKVYAAGYGEFRAQAEDELVTVALAVPTDAAADPEPSELREITSGAGDVMDALDAEDWAAASDALRAITTAWSAYRQLGVPELLDEQLTTALAALTEAVGAQDRPAAAQAAIEVSGAGLDLELRHRPVVEIDLARLGLWARQLIVDADADQRGAVLGDVVVIDTIWTRAGHSVDAADTGAVVALLDELRSAADRGDVAAAREAATSLSVTVAGLLPS